MGPYYCSRFDVVSSTYPVCDMTLENPCLHLSRVGCSCCLASESGKIVSVRHSCPDDISGEGSSTWKSSESNEVLRFCGIDWPGRRGSSQAFERNPLSECLLIGEVSIRYILHHGPLARGENVHGSFQDYQADNQKEREGDDGLDKNAATL